LIPKQYINNEKQILNTYSNLLTIKLPILLLSISFLQISLIKEQQSKAVTLFPINFNMLYIKALNNQKTIK